MRTTAVLLTLAAVAACTGPYRPRSAEGHAEPERLAAAAAEEAPPAEAAPAPVPDWPRPEPPPENPFAGTGLFDSGAFLVVFRQSDEPPETNPYVTDDGMEMVANHMMDDERATSAVMWTLEGAGMELAGSGGHGHVGIYVRYEEAGRARRLLMRVPGAEIPLPADVPEGAPGVFWSLPPLPHGTPHLELIAGTCRENAPTFDRAVALVEAAGIATQVLPRHGTRSLLVPTIRAGDARQLVQLFPGAVEASIDSPAPRGDLLVFPSPRVRLPGRSVDADDSWENVAFYRDVDNLAGGRIYGALDRAGIDAGGVSNAGGASVGVPSSVAERARLILRVIPGAHLERGYEEEVPGEFWIDGVNVPRITKKRGKAPRPGVGREWVAEYLTHDHDVSWKVAEALEIAGFDVSGAFELDPEKDGFDAWSTRLSVPEREADAARRVVRLLPSGERIVR